MSIITVGQYQTAIKEERDKFFKTSYERAYAAFCELGYDRQPSQFFAQSASSVVERMRNQCWDDFLKEEAEFTVHMLEYLIGCESYDGMTASEGIKHYVRAFPKHIYQLCLSNTQSRRSRAGKEFEHIIELILIGAGVPLDSQANIGKEAFINKGLGKLVDAVSPGITEFEINKRNTVLISAKTTLRERWQEVPEEMGRTGAREMFLATLDDKVSREVQDTLYEGNIQLTTTEGNRQKNYGGNGRIVSFEELVRICQDNARRWDGYSYLPEQAEQAISLLERQKEKHRMHGFVREAYEKRIRRYKD